MENFVLNEVWGVEIAAEMTLLAVGSFSIVLALLSHLEGRRRDAIMGGFITVATSLLAMIILNLHLLKPEAAILIFTNPQPSSWMVWGATGIVLLLLTSALFTLLLLLNRKGAMVIGGTASAAGIFVAVYTGLVLAYERGIPFWHSAAVPIMALVMGVVGGLSAFSIIRPRDLRITLPLGAALLLLIVIYIIHLHISAIGPAAAKYSAEVAVGSPIFAVGVLAGVLGGSAGLATIGLKSPYLARSAAVLGILCIAALRYNLVASGAWEFPLM